MTYEQFDEKYADQWQIANYHMNYIMENGDPSEYTICNGDTMIEAVESGYLYEEFRDYWIEKEKWTISYGKLG